eukprot:Opistho-1_new@32357
MGVATRTKTKQLGRRTCLRRSPLCPPPSSLLAAHDLDGLRPRRTPEQVLLWWVGFGVVVCRVHGGCCAGRRRRLRRHRVGRNPPMATSPRDFYEESVRAADFLFRTGGDADAPLYVWLRGRDMVRRQRPDMGLFPGNQFQEGHESGWCISADGLESSARIFFRLGHAGPFAEGVTCGFARHMDRLRLDMDGEFYDGKPFCSDGFLRAIGVALPNMPLDRAFGVVSIALSLVFGYPSRGKVVPGHTNFAVDLRTGRPELLVDRGDVARFHASERIPGDSDLDLVSPPWRRGTRAQHKAEGSVPRFVWPVERGAQLTPFSLYRRRGTRRREA